MSRSIERPCTTMFGELAALIIFGTKALILTAEVPQLISLTEVERGNNVSLKCSASEDRFFYWYKQSFGHALQIVASSIMKETQVNDSRFTLTRVNDQYLLNISNVSKEDEATYFCQNGSSYQLTFVGGTFLAVNDQDQQKHYSVKQSPETASVRPGASVILQCSLLSEHKENLVQCPGEHRVHWFRAGSGRSHPGIIYTQSSRRDGQEEKSCVYSLSKTIHNSSDAGTYYCAVVTCGEILFGGGTKVETRQEQLPLVIVLGTLTLCCIIVIVALILFRKKKTVCEHCKGAATASHPDGSAEDQPNDAEGDAAAMNYAALGFNSRKATRWNNRNSPEDCTYSSIRKSVRQ